ncbi:MAG: glycoside hydrolase family 15 protein [Chloroflexota bacterium]|nr:glycoside hydrolase family 15 protein [Chloroflexota bacterium]
MSEQMLCYPGVAPAEQANREVHNPLYYPIDAYGIIGDCHSAVLIAPDGSIDWGCFPDFDSPAIFCRLLDAQRGGFFQIAPADRTIPGTQRYLSDSNVLQTRFASIKGEIVLTDFMPVDTLEAFPNHGVNKNESGSRHRLVRIVECSHGELSVMMSLKVSPDYAATPSEICMVPGHLGALISGGDLHFGLAIIGASLLADFSLELIPDELGSHPSLVAQVILHKGERLIFTLSIGCSQQAVRELVEQESQTYNFEDELAHTLQCWQQWIASCTYEGSYTHIVKRSALVLKLMTYAPSGAIIAAPTTSLPEELGGVRNWDYRYTWLRDATFTLDALNLLGFLDEAQAFLDWLRHLPCKEGEGLQVMYGIRGECHLPEQELPHLEGYYGSAPVRIGNGAVTQKQMDIFGEVLDGIHIYQQRGGFERRGERLDGSLWKMMQTVIEYVCDHWQDADYGIWEVRGSPRHFVYSKVMCWVALDRGIRIAEELYLEGDVARWHQVRQHIRQDILSRGYNTEIGAFTQSYGSVALDAATLMLPLVGFIAPDDPRMLSTVECILKQLTDKQGFVYRYHTGDGLTGHEGTFAMCSFWLVDNLALQGRVNEARALFEQLLSYANSLGLFSEEIDSKHGLALGNFPQALTHIAVINSAHNLQQAQVRITHRLITRQDALEAVV